MLRGILINPIDREVSEIFIASGLEGLKYALSADPAFSGMVECVGLGPNLDLWICEEGNLHEGRPVFALKGNADSMHVSGAAILLCNGGEGECQSVPAGLVDAVLKSVSWTNLETTGDFGEPREYVIDHPIMGPNCPVFEGGKPIYRERAEA